MRCASVGLIPDAELLLLLEDDTTVPANAWARLTAALDAGYDWVSGFEVGRWDFRCPGVWRITPRRVETPPPGKGVEPVDATGLYLVLTRPDIYRSQKWDVWDNGYGHDVSVTYRMTLAGYRLAVDWDARCIHMTEAGDLDTSEWKLVERPNPGHTPILHSTPMVPLHDFPAGIPRLKPPATQRARRRKDVYVCDPKEGAVRLLVIAAFKSPRALHIPGEMLEVDAEYAQRLLDKKVVRPVIQM